jgi:hypothetical protein
MDDLTQIELSEQRGERLQLVASFAPPIHLVTAVRPMRHRHASFGEKVR